MRRHTLTGNIKVHRAFASKFLGNQRDILVYLPPGYQRFSWRRHSVLYLHDGQNVFDAATSFGGVEWGVDETAERLIRSKAIDPIIIVAGLVPFVGMILVLLLVRNTKATEQGLVRPI